MDGTDVIDPDETIADEPTPEIEAAEISAHRSAPDRVVFTESGNCDGWIALDADSTVTLGR